jgi:TonB-linked SusC/RagA family outer membrane protein
VIAAAYIRRHVSRIVMLALGLLVLPAARARSQTGRVAGTVSDSVTGLPVTQIQVIVVGTTLAGQTRDDGRYTISGVTPGTYTLETRRLGYAPVRRTGVIVTAGQTATVDFRIGVAPLRLQETVVTGVVDPTSGTKVPFTVGRVTREDAPVPPLNAIAGVQGKVAGVTMVPPNQPGAGVSIFLRSPSSINKTNTPLFVVDGVILSDIGSLTTADLNSLDIESIEVVKGAAGASLYGSRASSGIISIKTRRGTDLGFGQSRFSVRSEIGSSAIAHELEWAQYHYYLVNANGEWVNTAGTVVPRSQRVSRPASERFQDQRYGVPTYDPVKEFFDPGGYIVNSITMAQNGDRTNFLTTLSQQDQKGVILGNGGYNRKDVRINLDHRPRQDVSFSLSGFHQRSDRDEIDGDPFFDLIHQAPDVNLLEPDPDGSKYKFQPDPEGIRVNPLYTVTTQDSRSQRLRTLGAVDLRYAPLSWLSVDGNLSYDRSDRNSRTFIDRGVKTPNSPSGGVGSLTLSSNFTDAVNGSGSASLLKDFGALTARSTFRVIGERQKNVNQSATGTDLAVAGVPRMGAAKTWTSSSLQEDIRSESYLGTFGADYGGRYIVDALLRRDGSSLFGPGQQWAGYYRMSGAYRVAEERWWPWQRINEFKLRFSQGTAGNRPSFADQFETYSVTNGVLEKNTLGNRLLRPEQRTEKEVGLDAIVDNRYSLQISYADSKTTDELVQIPLPGAIGYALQWQNAGTVRGHTLEGTVEAQMIQRPGFSWKLGVVADRSRNHISEFNRSCVRAASISYRCVGEDLGTMWGLKYASALTELPAVHANSGSAFEVNDDGLLVAVGTGGHYTDAQKWGTNLTIDGQPFAWGMPIVIKDSTNQGAVLHIGTGNARFHYGISNNIRWRGFQVYGLLDTQVGGDIYNGTKQRMYQYGRSTDEDQVGKPDGQKKPIDYYALLYNGNTVNSWFVEPGGYVKLREVSVRYQLPRTVVNRLHAARFSNASLVVIGRNLYTWTRYSGYDPDVGTAVNRFDSFEYPAYRTITGTIQFDW